MSISCSISLLGRFHFDIAQIDVKPLWGQRFTGNRQALTSAISRLLNQKVLVCFLTHHQSNLHLCDPTVSINLPDLVLIPKATKCFAVTTVSFAVNSDEVRVLCFKRRYCFSIKGLIIVEDLRF